VVEYQLARSYARVLGGIQAKVAAAVTGFGVVVGTIGLIVDIPEIAKMIACG
jgi:hypothetical protein